MSGMHLLPVYYSTTNTRKRKQKKKSASVLEAERQHAKFLKKMGISSRSSAGTEQRSSKPWVTGSSPVESTKSQTRSSVWLERTAHNGYVAGSNPAGSTNNVLYDSSMSKKPENVYTGTEIIGIAQMHKSNAVPVRNKKSAEEVAKMRRWWKQLYLGEKKMNELNSLLEQVGTLRDEIQEQEQRLLSLKKQHHAFDDKIKALLNDQVRQLVDEKYSIRLTMYHELKKKEVAKMRRWW
jgi:hypothetical protein